MKQKAKTMHILIKLNSKPSELCEVSICEARPISNWYPRIHIKWNSWVNFNLWYLLF